MRVTIKPHLRHYFDLLQQQLECQDPTEALNYLLMTLKVQGFSFLADYQYVAKVQQPPYKPESLPQDDIPQNEDPVIKKLLSLGLEDF